MSGRLPGFVPYDPNARPASPLVSQTLPPQAPIFAPPATGNPNGLDPFPSQTWASGAHYVDGGKGVSWQLDGSGTYYQAYVWSALINIRPEWNLGEQVPHNATPVAGGSTAGLNRYFPALIFPAGTTNPPATRADLRLFSTEYNGIVSSDRMGKMAEVERTVEMQSGGTTAGTTTEPPGASLIQFCVPSGVRFWKVCLRFQWPATSGSPPPLIVDMASN